MWTCHQCESRNSDPAGICKVCGYTQELEPLACPACEALQDSSLRYCSVCGQNLHEKVEEEGPKAVRLWEVEGERSHSSAYNEKSYLKSRSKIYVYGWIPAIILLSFGIGMLVLLFRAFSPELVGMTVILGPLFGWLLWGAMMWLKVPGIAKTIGFKRKSLPLSTKSGRLLKRNSANCGIEQIYFTLDGDNILIREGNRCVVLRDADTKKIVRKWLEVEDQNQFLISRHLVFSYSWCTLEAFSQDGKLIRFRTLRHEPEIESVAVSEKGDRVIFTNGSKIVRWDILKNTTRHFTAYFPVFIIPFHHQDGFIGYAGNSGFTKYDCRTGMKRNLLLAEHQGMRKVQVSPSGKYLVLTDENRRVKVYLTEKKGSGPLFSFPTKAEVSALGFCDENIFILGTAGGEILLIRTPDGTELSRIETGMGKITAVDYHSGSRRLAAGDESGNLQVWDLQEVITPTIP